MDFIDDLKQLATRVAKIKGTIQTEEATKMSLIVPFFQLLGYDVFNPDEFVPEYIVDFGTKKGEKVDYAIFLNDNPIILIEAKHCSEKLDNHGAQLFRYFSTSEAKFGILTNGIKYSFYTDLENSNIMDAKPFLELDMLNLRDYAITEVKKFSKHTFDADSIFSTASELKYSNEFKNVLSKELQEPTDEFIKFFLTGIYSGAKTQNVIDKFRSVIKQALNNYISETMNDKIKLALESNQKFNISEYEGPKDFETEDTKTEEKNSIIITTHEELEAFFIVKNLLKETVPIEDINYKDTTRYMGVLYKNNTRKWICRFELTENKKILIIPTEDKKDQRFSLSIIYQIEEYKDSLIEVVKRYI